MMNILKFCMRNAEAEGLYMVYGVYAYMVYGIWYMVYGIDCIDSSCI